MLRSTLPSRSTHRVNLVLLVCLAVSSIVGVGAINRWQGIAPTFDSGIAAQSSTSNTSQAAQADLPFPSWWSGECDTSNYSRATGRASYPLGGSYRGVKACGPGHKYDGGGNLSAFFFKGAFPVLEWECVELVKRYMYLAYGIAPYQANGSEVVSNYKGDKLKQIKNGTPGQAPKPGDVMSYGATPPGHTSIVVEAQVDGSGNGSIKTLNQNMQPFNAEAKKGYRTEAVRNWTVQNDATGWLTPKSNQPPNIPNQVLPRNGEVLNTRQVTLQWNDIGDPDNGPRQSRSFKLEVRSNGMPTFVGNSPVSTVFTFNAPADGTYYWKVQSHDGADPSAWTGEFSFVINTSPCARKIEGDANCDGRIDLEDFEIFREEFIAQMQKNRTTNRSDFNNDGSVDLLDFELFREGFIKERSGKVAPTSAVRADDQDGTVGEATAFYFEQTHSNVAPDGSVDVDVYVESNPGTQVSSTDMTLQYPPELLEYDESAKNEVSQACQNANVNHGYLDQSPSISNDPSTGLLRVTRTATSDDTTLPYGRLCAGTFRFKVKDGITTPVVAHIRLAASDQAADAAGPQSALVPQFNNARQTFNVVIGSPAAAPAAPTGLQTDESTESTISLQWNDMSVDEDGFNVYRWNPDTADWDLLSWGGPNITSASDIELNCGTIYFYQVSAFNSNGESARSDRIAVQTSACPVSEGTPQPTSQPPVSTPPAPSPTPQPDKPSNGAHQIFLPMTMH
jgi:hypothetical protein